MQKTAIKGTPNSVKYKMAFGGKYFEPQIFSKDNK